MSPNSVLKIRIIFAGSQQTMQEIYHMSDVIVTCSRKPESFGRSLIEAMAMDTPVIAPAQGGPLDIIQDGQTGLLIDNTEPETIARRYSQSATDNFCRAAAIRP